MKILLGVIRSDILDSQAPPHRQHHLDLLQEITPDKYREYEQAVETLNSVMANANLFTIVQWNFQAFLEAVVNQLGAYATKDTDRFGDRPIHLELNRHALNHLSSVRTFLDHLETSISRRHGPNSQNIEGFREFCSQVYNAQFSYRFLYRLRNYAQHCGLPISEIKLSTKPSEDDPAKPIHSLSVSISRDHLLRKFDWGSLETELAAQPASIDFAFHMQNQMAALDEINERFVESELPALLESAKQVMRMVGQIEYDEGQPALFEFEDDLIKEDEPDKLNIEALRFRPIPVELAQAVLKSENEATESPAKDTEEE